MYNVEKMCKDLQSLGLKQGDTVIPPKIEICIEGYNIDQTDFYISNGLGNNYNIRLFNHPSINLFRLK